jgi:hypothetical protein
MCKPRSWLDVVSSLVCGSCQYAPIKEHWDELVMVAETVLRGLDPWAEADAYGEAHKRLEELREERDKDEWACKKKFPVTKKEIVEEVVAIIRPIVSKPSPLRREVFAEDIVDREMVRWNIRFLCWMTADYF